MAENKPANSTLRATMVVFWLIIALYALILVFAFMPMEARSLKQATGVAFIPIIGILVVLGVTELIMVLRDRNLARLRRGFLLLTAIATIGTPVSIILHNVVSYLVGIWFGASEEGFFFIMALIVFPILFIVGAAGSIITMIGNGRDRAVLA